MEANQDKNKYIYIYAAIWLTLVLVSFFVGIFLTDGMEHYRLKTKGIEVQGRVTAKEPQNHQSVRYTYTVERQNYNEIGRAGRGNSSFESIKIGDPFIVYYDPDKPSSSVSGYPDYYFQDSIAGAAFLVVVFPLFAVIGLYVKGYLKPKNAVEQFNGREARQRRS